MNEVTYLLAILIHKDVLSLEEAKLLQKALRESVTNTNLKEMIEKVSKALERPTNETPVLSATEVLGR